MASVTLFAGPSAHGISLDTAGDDVRRLPPARRGDIDRLTSEKSDRSVIVLCDGVFQAEPAVSHAELCRALDTGWEVWGVSSLGAIRAHELRSEGMLGFGYVHAQFDRFADFTDDEMCLLHFPEAPYFPVSEALVNLRFALERRGDVLGIDAAARETIVERLRLLWFGDRTEDAIRRVMLEEAAIDPPRVNELLGWLANHRVKAIDLADLMTARPWAR